jgi:CDP-glucose 4,6-dehydratase
MSRGWNFGPSDDDARSVRWLAERLARLWDGGIVLEECRDGDDSEAVSLRLDCSLARDRLGWRPRWELDLALEKTVDWYRAFAAGERMHAQTLAEIAEFEAGVVATEVGER